MSVALIIVTAFLGIFLIRTIKLEEAKHREQEAIQYLIDQNDELAKRLNKKLAEKPTLHHTEDR